jgi:GDP-L-fucose synthase
VIPGLIRRFHEAKVNNYPEVIIWGTGSPRREFLFVDDMASAAVFVMGLEKAIYDENTDIMSSHINVGSGIDFTIAELAELIKESVGYKGGVAFDSSRPDGTPKKLMKSARLKSLGWSNLISLEDGLRLTYADFKKL